jgi:hypothetical protein
MILGGMNNNATHIVNGSISHVDNINRAEDTSHMNISTDHDIDSFKNGMNGTNGHMNPPSTDHDIDSSKHGINGTNDQISNGHIDHPCDSSTHLISGSNHVTNSSSSITPVNDTHIIDGKDDTSDTHLTHDSIAHIDSTSYQATSTHQ